MITLRLLTLLGLCFLLSCGETGDENDTYDIGSDSGSITGVSSDSIKLVKKAGVQIKVRNAQESVRNVSVLVRSMGGMITHQQIAATEQDTKELRYSSDSVIQLTSYSTTADITARVPAQHLEDFLLDVHALGYFTHNSQLSIDDKSLEYLVHQRQQQNRSAFLKTGPARPTKNSSATTSLLINDEMIEQERAQRQINLDVAYSTVQLQLVQNPMVRREIKVNTDLASYPLPFATQLTNALQGGWNLFLQAILVLANLWMFILAGMLLWWALRFKNKNRVPAMR